MILIHQFIHTSEERKNSTTTKQSINCISLLLKIFVLVRFSIFSPISNRSIFSIYSSSISFQRNKSWSKEVFAFFNLFFKTSCLVKASFHKKFVLFSLIWITKLVISFCLCHCVKRLDYWTDFIGTLCFIRSSVVHLELLWISSITFSLKLEFSICFLFITWLWWLNFSINCWLTNLDPSHSA